MICERCGEQEATVEYVDVVQGAKTSVWLCDDCAREEGVAAELDDEGVGETGGLPGFVGGLLGDEEPDEPDRPEAPASCPECGFVSTGLEEKGMLGCPACYGAFRSRVLPLLERYHRGVSHVGKTPRADGPRAALRRELADLRTALERAVAAESYEEAARLRDTIRERERVLARLSTAPPDDAPGTEDPRT
jgi:protein arginine kinase activator